jgi:hypothetical protein
LIGDGFLQSPAMTAAGIAGGALLFEGIRSVFGHNDAVSIIGNKPAVPGLAETVLNSHYGTEAGAWGVGPTDEHAGARHSPISIGETSAL